MSIKPALQLKIGQHLTMTPQLQQAIRLLQLSNMDLQAEIQTFLDTNPLIEIQEEAKEASEALKQIEAERHSQNKLNDDGDPPPAHAWEEKLYPAKNDLSEGFEPQRAQETSLRDYLIWQMQLTPFSETDQQIAMTLIDSINDDGFLDIQLEDVCKMIEAPDVDLDEVIAVLHRIQHFDPVGVGARDLKECLSIQLQRLPPKTAWLGQARLCVERYMDLIAKRDFVKLRRKLKVQESQLPEILKCIQALNPRPGSEIGTKAPDYVIPDAFVFKHQSEWVIELNPENTPKLNINQHYAQLIKRADTSSDNQYLKDQLLEARWFLKSLQNRHETLLKVTRAIVEHQCDFFEHGEHQMKPMILHDVATQINMHESTISRVTTQKYIHTPRGTFELKYFFSSHVQNQEGEECSSTAIRALIKQTISQEDKKKPLSDNKIAAILQESGIQVARRTVAKYREALKIPPSNERKRLV